MRKCQWEEETRDHLLRCERAAEWHFKCLQIIGARYESLRTNRGLQSILIRGLTMAWFQGDNQLTAGGYTPKMMSLIHSQNAIGWGQMEHPLEPHPRRLHGG